LPPLLRCSQGCTESECPYKWVEFYGFHDVSVGSFISEIEKAIEPVTSGLPRVLCAYWVRFDPSYSNPEPWKAAPEQISVKGTSYELAAILHYDEVKKHHTATTKRGGKWAVFDDDNAPRTLDGTELQNALITGPVYFYQKRGATRSKPATKPEETVEGDVIEAPMPRGELDAPPLYGQFL